MTVKMGQRELELGGKYLGHLREANDLLHDPAALRARMEEDGYLLIRGAQEVERVRAARRVVLENLDANGQLDRGYPLMEGVAKEGARGQFLGGRKEITRRPEFLALVESPQIMGFFEHFLGGPALTYDYKWLRAIGPGSNSGAHYDIVYMGRGTQDVYTTWTPLGDVPLEMGPLVALVGSHRFERMRETYGKMDVDRDHVTGSFSNDPAEVMDRHGGQWQTSAFKAGDVLIFGMFTMHGSLNNVSNRFRLSTDTRYQLASEPVDERWIGEDPIAHYAWTKGETVPMEVVRAKWGV
ncbi:MAG: phytanoyl-CoA dioxygenase [Candidatus Handelsmanbacteria bacterium RIFCSPLOWO2_12_FULL_64_10]|uniref:Phytanoyl-CoA dioxygenase n=1 Tax=Handelsmanbacteria sp. (strain RIFCSPLOWO2_12_FULL_64_10) TaxID=1817868 RepID=A0A1F6CCN0_HANXR|nr:MAG: phytanoyl-CoA dioxygenase [Candidatus Handelsmanbacteria bacterium RIFCSPLOWO2_12_FULL_64_10]